MTKIKLTKKTPAGDEEIERDPDLIDYLVPHLWNCSVVFLDGERVEVRQSVEEVRRRIKEAKGGNTK